jgi:hypothetical protein
MGGAMGRAMGGAVGRAVGGAGGQYFGLHLGLVPSPGEMRSPCQISG